MAFTRLDFTDDSGTASQAFEGIVSFLTDTPGTPGRDWVMLEDRRDSGDGTVILRNTGASGSESVVIGLQRWESCIQVRPFRHWDVGADLWGQDNPYGADMTDPSNARYAFCPLLTMWDGPLSVWVASNAYRIVLVAKVQNIYFAAYAGQILRYAQPSEHPFPLLVLADGHRALYNGGYTSTYSATSYTDLTHHTGLLWPDTGQEWSGHYPKNCNGLCLPSNQWAPVGIMPTEGARPDPGLVYPSGAARVLIPARVQAQGMAFGELDGVFWLPNQSNTAESSVTIGEDTYRVFPRLNSVLGHQFMAVLEA